MVYDLVVYAAILFGPSLIAGSLGLGPVTFTIVMQLVFVIPASIVFGWFIIDRFGRKPLQIWGFAAGSVIIALFAVMQHTLAATPLIALVVFGLFNVVETGPGIVSGAGILGVELAPTRIRSVAQSITVAGGRIGASISGFAFPLIFGSLGKAAAYWIIAGLGALGAFLTWRLVPETGRISLETITGETTGAR
jgi:MFS family permease